MPLVPMAVPGSAQELSSPRDKKRRDKERTRPVSAVAAGPVERHSVDATEPGALVTPLLEPGDYLGELNRVRSGRKRLPM